MENRGFGVWSFHLWCRGPYSNRGQDAGQKSQTTWFFGLKENSIFNRVFILQYFVDKRSEVNRLVGWRTQAPPQPPQPVRHIFGVVGWQIHNIPPLGESG